MTLNILGTKYKFTKSDQKQDSKLVNANGYCERYSKEIVIATDLDDGSVNVAKNLDEAEKKIIRHEIIHAFFFESGLDEYCEDEKLVDWVAIQFPKLLKMFNEANAL